MGAGALAASDGCKHSRRSRALFNIRIYFLVYELDFLLFYFYFSLQFLFPKRLISVSGVHRPHCYIKSRSIHFCV